MVRKRQYNVKVKVEYIFSFESSKTLRRELHDEAEEIWNMWTNTGRED